MITIAIIECLGSIHYCEVPAPISFPYDNVTVREMVEYYGDAWRKARFISRGTHESRDDSVTTRDQPEAESPVLGPESSYIH